MYILIHFCTYQKHLINHKTTKLSHLLLDRDLLFTPFSKAISDMTRFMWALTASSCSLLQSVLYGWFSCLSIPLHVWSNLLTTLVEKSASLLCCECLVTWTSACTAASYTETDLSLMTRSAKVVDTPLLVATECVLSSVASRKENAVQLFRRTFQSVLAKALRRAEMALMRIFNQHIYCHLDTLLLFKLINN